MANAKLNFVTEEVRLLYPNVVAPRLNKLSGKMEYTITALVKKGGKLDKKLNTIINDLIKEQWGDKVPKNLKTPLKDGDVTHPEDAAYKGHYHFTAKSEEKCGVIDGTNGGADVFTKEIVYGGCYGLLDITVSTFDQPANKGVTIYLQNVCKTKDGDFLGGKKSAQKAFADYISVADNDGDDEESDMLS